VRLDNRVLVEWEYASEERLAKRSAIQHELICSVNRSASAPRTGRSGCGSISRVETRPVESELMFPTPETTREFVASTIDRSHLAPKVPDFDGLLRTVLRQSIFVAEKAR
jgi:hypothetical protein